MAPAYVESIGGCSGVGPLRPEKTLGECLDRSPAGPFPARGAGARRRRRGPQTRSPGRMVRRPGVLSNFLRNAQDRVTAGSRFARGVHGHEASPPAVRSGFPNLVKGEIPLDSKST